MSDHEYEDDFEEAPLTPPSSGVRFDDVIIGDEKSAADEKIDPGEHEEESSESSGSSEEESSDDSSDSDDDSDLDTSEDESDSEDDEKIEVKVKIEGTTEVRGFREKAKRMLKVVHRCFAADYDDVPFVLTYRDAEGDVIKIRGFSDLKYARQNHIGVGKNTLTLFAKLQRRSDKLDLNLSLNETLPLPPPLQQLSPLRSSYRDDKRRGEVSLRTQSAGLASSSVLTSSSGDFMWQKGAHLGSGSFGSVFSAIDIISGEQIAVKEVDLTKSSNKRQNQQMKLLQREILILSDLSHPNIIHYIGAELAEDVLRIFLELADQGSVKGLNYEENKKFN